MVGAGYSFNAKKDDDSAEYISWERLGQKVTEALYKLRGEPIPESDPGNFDADSLLVTAQEYKELAVARGAKSLDDLIYETTSDKALSPGPLHRKLLALNWSDIYTTNYDRLFERTLEEDKVHDTPVIHTRYNLIARESGLPGGKPVGTRRLIKLHGSFPDVKPFLLAQDDYKAYPETNELFVQAVRNALVTEVFCLIGFSGTDPNFKSWVEWVSEKLKGGQPKMYLIDFADPKPSDVAYYKLHNIVHVNIAPLAGLSQCEDNPQRQSALDVFLDRLKVDYPEEPLWSYDGTNFSQVDPFEGVPLDTYVKAASVLREKRASYPDWVFPPLEVARKAEFCFMNRYLPNYPKLLLSPEFASDRLLQWLIAYEYLWAYDTFCIPPDALEGSGIEALAVLVEAVWPLQYDAGLETRLGALPESIAVGRAAFIRSLQDAACIFMRLWRRYGAESGVAVWRKALAESLAASSNADAENWSQYNAILWCLENCDPAGADRLLDVWMPEGGDLYWKTRKANLLAERGKTTESKDLLKSSLVDIRERIHQEGQSAYLLSREAWTERFLEVVKENLASREPIEDVAAKASSHSYETLSRTPVLRRLAFHPLQILSKLRDQFDYIGTRQPMGEPELDFFSGSEDSNTIFMSGFQEGVHPAHVFYGLLEKTALPTRIELSSSGVGRLSNQIWMNGTTVLLRVYRYHHPFVFPWVHRMLEPDVFKKNQILFSRYALANLEQERACRAFDLALTLLNQFFDTSRTDPEQRSLNDRSVRFLLLYLGRLCPLLDDSRQEELLTKASYWYSHDGFFDYIPTAKAFIETFILTIRSAPPAVLGKHLFSLMSLPLVPERIQCTVKVGQINPVHWPEVLKGRDLNIIGMDWDAVAIHFLEELASKESWLNSLAPSQSLGRANALPAEVAAGFDKLLEKMQPAEDIRQKNCLLSPYWSALIWLKDENLLTERAISRISEHLWKEYSGLAPEIPGFPAYAACWYFPLQEQQNCIGDFKARLFNEENAANRDPLFWIAALGNCLEFPTRYPLSHRELDLLLTALRLTVVPAPRPDSPFGRHDDKTLKSIMQLIQAWGGNGLSPSDKAGQANRNDIRAWLDQLRKYAEEYGYGTEALDIMLLEFAPQGAHELADKLRTQLFIGPRREEVGLAVLYWKYVYSGVVPIPAEYSDMVADCFKNMRLPDSMELINVLKAQAGGYREQFSEREVSAIARGLGTLFDELGYGIPSTARFSGEHPALKPYPLKTPYYRETVALFLKAALARDASFGNIPEVRKWVESLCEEPLADIRNILL